jgi:hypothetical protein
MSINQLREKFELEKVNMETARQNYEKAFKNPKLTEKDVAAVSVDNCVNLSPT